MFYLSSFVVSSFRTIGILLFFLGGALLFSLVVSVIFLEDQWWVFLISGGISFLLGGILYFSLRFHEVPELKIREGFFIVSVTWLLFALIGAIPYYLSDILDYTDAFFESMSGLSTTGSSVLGGKNSYGMANPDIEDLPYGLLFWRSLSQWLGGMGIIVLSIAALPLLGLRGIHLFQAESPGPSLEKMTPQLKGMAKLLWITYFALTILLFFLLWLDPSMNWFDALNHAMTTMATGGFSTKNKGIIFFDSWYVEMVIAFFMWIAGWSFSLWFLISSRNILGIWKNVEWRFYTFYILFFIVLLLMLFSLTSYSFSDSFRYAVFQAISITTTTGFVSHNYLIWPDFLHVILLILFFSGGCSGSTGGGIKMIRIRILLENIKQEFFQILHPNAVLVNRIGSQPVPSLILRQVLTFFLVYIGCVVVGTALISLLGYDVFSAFGSAITCLGNIGPGWGEFGPTESFAHVPAVGKWILSFLMLIGRLELFTVLVLFSPSFWRM